MLIKYNSENNVRFHMPGHKGRTGVDRFEYLLDIAPYDVTEVPGTDNLHNPFGAVLSSEKLLAEAYGAEKSFLLVNGSTCGIFASVASAFNKGDRVLAAGNCHKCVFNAIDLLGIECILLNEIKPEHIKFSASRFNCKGLIITRPDYYGICADINLISDLCRELNLLLITDEAHGAHLNFADHGYPESAVKYSDFTVQSAHKTIGGLNQSAFLHLNNRGVNYCEQVRKNLSIFQTSSPSYIILASADIARSNMAQNGKFLLEKLLKNIDWAVGEIKKRTRFKVEQEENLPPDVSRTPDRLVINTLSGGIKGFFAEKYLRELSVQVELSDEERIVCLCSVFDRREDFEKLVNALAQLSESFIQIRAQQQDSSVFTSGQVEMLYSSGTNILSLYKNLNKETEKQMAEKNIVPDGFKGKIYCVMGKSGSGKDTVFKELIKKTGFKPMVTYTTRPMRKNEENGADYFFINDGALSQFRKSGKIVEERQYDTVNGIWRYATIDDGRTDLSKDSYIIITTLDAYNNIKKYFGSNNVFPILIEVEDGLRLERNIKREQKEAGPNYAEICRRFLSDREDFSPDKLESAGVVKFYENKVLEKCLSEIINDIFSDIDLECDI